MICLRLYGVGQSQSLLNSNINTINNYQQPHNNNKQLRWRVFLSFMNPPLKPIVLLPEATSHHTFSVKFNCIFHLASGHIYWDELLNRHNLDKLLLSLWCLQNQLANVNTTKAIEQPFSERICLPKTLNDFVVGSDWLNQSTSCPISDRTRMN